MRRGHPVGLRAHAQRDDPPAALAVLPVRARLAAVYEWFTEGFGTKDLLEAKALLDELQR